MTMSPTAVYNMPSYHGNANKLYCHAQNATLITTLLTMCHNNTVPRTQHTEKPYHTTGNKDRQFPYVSSLGYMVPDRYAYNNPRISSDTYVKLKDVPVELQCPNCYKYVHTKIQTRASSRTVAMAVAIATVYWPLAVLPFVTQWMKKTVHICPCCRHDLGKIVTVSTNRMYN
ncbi:hypothetical protein BX661DRAFT_66875 [Kickxella alabastrina]|uniref:uncharacterized protein n=1 Tax=Kickxella alabastrina TaxID=61397 RepID=UPI00221E90DA|nr:uncharacterized protein BX661DRAFT_66875 [Kickxella alabastrina]KAI7833945.1 hypothetical protein BX661DRAFT_66875 [Kickxella alabastrina]